MAKYKLSYTVSGTGPDEVEANAVNHEGKWIIFQQDGETVLSLRDGDVSRYERTEASPAPEPFVL